MIEQENLSGFFWLEALVCLMWKKKRKAKRGTLLFGEGSTVTSESLKKLLQHWLCTDTNKRWSLRKRKKNPSIDFYHPSSWRWLLSRLWVLAAKWLTDMDEWLQDLPMTPFPWQPECCNAARIHLPSRHHHTCVNAPQYFMHIISSLCRSS